MVASNVPLSTIFTPPPDCLASITDYESALSLGANSTCYPSGTTLGVSSYFSPALNCPSGWTTAVGTTATAGSVTETRATCCPILGHLNNFVGDSSMFPDPVSGCTAWIYGSVIATLVPAISNQSTTTLAYDPSVNIGILYAPTVQIAWQISDLLPTSSSTSASPASSPAPPMSATLSATPTPTHSSGGLSTTAKISIGVVIPVVVLAALLLLGCFILRRRKNKSKSSRREIQQEIIQGAPVSQIEPSSHSEKYQSPQIGYTQLPRGHHDDEWNDSQRWSNTDHTHVDHAPSYSRHTSPNMR